MKKIILPILACFIFNDVSIAIDTSDVKNLVVNVSQLGALALAAALPQLHRLSREQEVLDKKDGMEKELNSGWAKCPEELRTRVLQGLKDYRHAPRVVQAYDKIPVEYWDNCSLEYIAALEQEYCKKHPIKAEVLPSQYTISNHFDSFYHFKQFTYAAMASLSASLFAGSCLVGDSDCAKVTGIVTLCSVGASVVNRRSSLHATNDEFKKKKGLMQADIQYIKHIMNSDPTS